MPPAKPTTHNFSALLKWFEKIRWIDMRTASHLQSEEAAERLTTLLALHLLLDRAVTELLARRLLDPERSQDLETVEVEVSRVNFSNRIELAKAARLISDSCAGDMKAVNKVRNDFAHCQHKRSKKGGGSVPEISSKKDFDRCMERGERAFTELNGILVEHLIEPPTTPG